MQSFRYIGFRGLILALGFLSQASYGQSILEVQCAKQEHPTGCAYPYETCQLGKINDARQSCRSEARKSLCPDFTWEKCCFVTCRQVQRQRIKGGNYTACMETCNAAPESYVYTPTPPKRMSRSR